MSEFCHREEIRPCFRFIGCKKSKIGLQFLIHSFCFPVHLRVTGCGQGNVIIEKLGEFLSEGGCELRTSVRNHLGVKRVATPIASISLVHQQ